MSFPYGANIDDGTENSAQACNDVIVNVTGRQEQRSLIFMENVHYL